MREYTVLLDPPVVYARRECALIGSGRRRPPPRPTPPATVAAAAPANAARPLPCCKRPPAPHPPPRAAERRPSSVQSRPPSQAMQTGSPVAGIPPDGSMSAARRYRSPRSLAALQGAGRHAGGSRSDHDCVVSARTARHSAENINGAAPGHHNCGGSPTPTREDCGSPSEGSHRGSASPKWDAWRTGGGGGGESAARGNPAAACASWQPHLPGRQRHRHQATAVERRLLFARAVPSAEAQALKDRVKDP